MNDIEKCPGVPTTGPVHGALDELPESLRESNRRQSDHISRKLEQVGCGIRPITRWDTSLFEFSAREIEDLSVMEHLRWNEERLLEGWRYAPGEKNIEKKASPWIVRV